MAKRNHTCGSKKATCDKCGAEAHSIPETIHRRCAGAPSAPIRPKHELIPSNNRGTWK